jgi:hypothetical protein
MAQQLTYFLGASVTHHYKAIGHPDGVRHSPRGFLYMWYWAAEYPSFITMHFPFHLLATVSQGNMPNISNGKRYFLDTLITAVKTQSVL